MKCFITVVTFFGLAHNVIAVDSSVSSSALFSAMWSPINDTEAVMVLNATNTSFTRWNDICNDFIATVQHGSVQNIGTTTYRLFVTASCTDPKSATQESIANKSFLAHISYSPEKKKYSTHHCRSGHENWLYIDTEGVGTCQTPDDRVNMTAEALFDFVYDGNATDTESVFAQVLDGIDVSILVIITVISALCVFLLLGFICCCLGSKGEEMNSKNGSTASGLHSSKALMSQTSEEETRQFK